MSESKAIKDVNVPQEGRHRCFAITVYSDQVPSVLSWAHFHCGQLECCPTTGRLHWQTYLYVLEAMTFTALRKALPASYNKPHIEKAYASALKNLQYCTKDATCVDPNTRFVRGEMPQQGRRVDWETACNEVIEGGLAAVSDNSMVVRYHRGLSTLETVRGAKRFKGYVKKRVIWRHGPTGTDKTRLAYEFDPELYHQTDPSGWFDGYVGQQTVLLDDFSVNAFPLRDMLQMLDGYSYRFRVKGSFVISRATTFIITSRYHPEAYFHPVRWPEIQRRITEIIDHSIPENRVQVAGASITPATSVESGTL